MGERKKGEMYIIFESYVPEILSNEADESVCGLDEYVENGNEHDLLSDGLNVGKRWPGCIKRLYY